MKLRIDEDRSLVLSEVYLGIGIEADAGMFGIAERDGGIEIMLNGRLVGGFYPYGHRLYEEPGPPDAAPAADTAQPEEPSE